MRKACNLLLTPHPPNDSVLATHSESYCTLFVWVLCYGFMDDKSYVGHWDGTEQSLARITASPLLVGSETTFTKFTTTFCCCPLRLYSSFCLASMIVAKTTSWMFLPCQSRGINAIMISLMWQNQLLLCALQFHWLYSNCHRDPCKVVLSLQTLPPRADTESDQFCRTEWGWLARLMLSCTWKDWGKSLY